MFHRGFVNHVLMVVVWCSVFAMSEQEPKCQKGQQPIGNKCVSQYMADFISCVEASGGNKEEISSEVSNAQGGKTSASAQGGGGNLAVHGEGALALDHATEAALQKKFRERWYSQSMETCLKALKSAPTNTPAKTTPKQHSDNASPAPGSISQGPGSALSFNQQGGITAGTINNFSEPPTRLLDEQQQQLLLDDLAKVPMAPFWIVIETKFRASGAEVETADEQGMFAAQLRAILTRAGWTDALSYCKGKSFDVVPCFPIQIYADVNDRGMWIAGPEHWSSAMALGNSLAQRFGMRVTMMPNLKSYNPNPENEEKRKLHLVVIQIGLQ